MTGSPADRLEKLIFDFPEPRLAQAINWLRQCGTPCFLVGGAVRDCLLATTAHFAPIRTANGVAGPPASTSQYLDLDFVVPGNARGLARRLADGLGAAYYSLDESRDVGRVVFGKDAAGTRPLIDIAGFQGDTLEADLRGRDFSINAIAVDLNGQPVRLVDPCGGLADLRVGLLRATSETAVQDDPIRALRAVRLRAQLGFEIEPRTRTLVTRASRRLNDTSPERVRDELAKTLCLAGATASLYELDSLGLLCVVFPELLEEKGVATLGCHQWDVFSHSLESVSTLEEMLPAGAQPDERCVPFPDKVADYLAEKVAGGWSRRTLLVFATLFHELGQPAMERINRCKPGESVVSDAHSECSANLATAILRRLHFSKEAIRMVGLQVRYHCAALRLAMGKSVDRRAAHRLFRDAEPAGVEAVLLALADNRAIIVPGSHTKEWPLLLEATRFLLDIYFNQPDVVTPPPLLDGDDLVRRFGVDRGPQLGRMLTELAEAQAAGDVHDEFQAAQWVKDSLAVRGRR